MDTGLGCFVGGVKGSSPGAGLVASIGFCSGAGLSNASCCLICAMMRCASSIFVLLPCSSLPWIALWIIWSSAGDAITSCHISIFLFSAAAISISGLLFCAAAIFILSNISCVSPILNTSSMISSGICTPTSLNVIIS